MTYTKNVRLVQAERGAPAAGSGVIAIDTQTGELPFNRVSRDRCEEVGGGVNTVKMALEKAVQEINQNITELQEMMQRLLAQQAAAVDM